ncbi:MAG: hypothetical protein L0Y48_04575 [Fusobacteria bacterium]|nr:hypothetical protein [Fusobacteriota bacterium]
MYNYSLSSFILGLAGFLLSCFILGPVSCFFGIILGIFALTKKPVGLDKTFAILGIVFGGLGLILYLVLLIFSFIGILLFETFQV